MKENYKIISRFYETFFIRQVLKVFKYPQRKLGRNFEPNIICNFGANIDDGNNWQDYINLKFCIFEGNGLLGLHSQVRFKQSISRHWRSTSYSHEFR